MIRTIFFDFDGVIVESVEIKTRAFARLFEHEGKDILKKIVDYHLQNTGISRFDKINYIYAKVLNRPLSVITFTDLCKKFSELVIDEVIQAPYTKGAKEFLEEYYSKYTCFVVSATPQEEMEEIIGRRKMMHFFKEIYGSPQKKTAVVKRILAGENLNPSESLYIGDALSDYMAAKDNSVKFIARINNNEAVFSGIDCLKLNDLTDLNSIIKTL